MRKVLIGFISLGGVLAAYLIYTSMSGSPVIENDSGGEFVEAIADSNVDVFDANVGKIGEIGIGTTKKAEYITLNEKTKEVERIWGFEELVHKERGLWKLKKPYVNVFEPDFTCYITADSGLAQMQTAAERSTPKDATFSGNVVIHVLPKETSDIKESFVYLDDVVFLSERSQLSTNGPIEYVSEDVHMLGRGLELIFNDQSDRLEYFRIFDLKMLRLKNVRTEMFSNYQQEANESADVKASVDTKQTDETAVSAGPEEKVESTAASPAAGTPEGVYYKCVLSKNVLIDTPNELIFADRRVFISDIFWSKEFMESRAKDPNDTKTAVVAGQAETVGDSNNVTPESTNETKVTAAAVEPNAPVEKQGDIVITCDNGFVLVPMDTNRSIDEFMQVSGGSDNAPPAKFKTDTERTKFITPRINYDAVTGDMVAIGKSELTFYSRDRAKADVNELPAPTRITTRDKVNFFKASNQVVFKGDCKGSMPQKDLTEPRDVQFKSPEITVNLPEDKSKRADVLAAGPVELTFYVQDTNDLVAAQDPNITDIPREPTPVTVTAQKQARFLQDLNQIVFEDNCNCTTIREDINDVTQYTLKSELITVDLPEDANDSTGGIGIKHLTASGGVVRLASKRTAKPDPNLAEYARDANEAEILGGVEVKCARIDFDPGVGLFEASGKPAEIWMDNSKVAVSDKNPNGFSLSEPCYAYLANYESLKYYINEDRIIAEAVPGEALWLYYFPVVDGVHDLDAMTTASAQRVEVFLVKTPDGRTELSTLAATGGIDITDLSNGNHFIGSDLYYDHKTSVMKITGDDSRPCLCNGALVDWIKYNVTTGKLDFDVVGPGAMQTNQQ